MGEDCMKHNSEEIEKLLDAPFPTEQVKWRATAFKGNNGEWKALLVPYLQNIVIMRRLDDVFGKFGWENQLNTMHGGVICGISVFLNGRTITKWDGADPTDTEATKGGITNSMKRAAVQWGIGRYLKDIPHNWVKVHQSRETDRDEYISNKKNNLSGFFTPPNLPSWARPIIDGDERSGDNSRNNKGNTTPTSKSEGAHLLEHIKNMEETIGLTKNPEFIPRIFNKAAGTQITHISEVETAPKANLESYYYVLRPVSQLCKAMDTNGWKLDQLLFHAQIVKPTIRVDSLFSLFFNLSDKEVKEIIYLAKTELNPKGQIA